MQSNYQHWGEAEARNQSFEVLRWRIRLLSWLLMAPITLLIEESSLPRGFDRSGYDPKAGYWWASAANGEK